MTFGLRHLVWAALLHVLLFALIAGGVQCTRPPQKPPVITAVIFNPQKPPAAAAPRPDRAAEQERLKRKLEEQKQRREAEQKRSEEQKRKLAEDKKRADLEARRLAEQKAAEERKAAEEARRKQEQDEKREREEAAQRELQRKLELEEELRREGLERQARAEAEANAASAREAALNAWVVALRDDIERNWVKPLSAPDQFNCALRVQLLPDGSVTSARIARSCGNAALDKSVEDAVYRASPLPKPTDPAVFQRDLLINYQP